MKRKEWEFPYSADKLLDASLAKQKHHGERLDWWSAKKEEVLTSIKAEGLEVDESLADLTSNSYRRNETVSVRADLLRDLRECIEKVKEHRELATGYAGWAEVFATQGQATFVLHQDDWLFFFGRK